MPDTTPRVRTKPDSQQKIIEAAIAAFVSRHPELRQATIVTEIPPTIRWTGIILGGIMTTGAAAGLLWLVSTVNTMQLTLTRMDERSLNWSAMQDTRYLDIEKRMNKIENRMEEKGNKDAAG